MLAGARAIMPIALAAAAFGVSFGMLARVAGMGVVPPVVFSLTTLAGSAQFAAASLLNLRYVAPHSVGRVGQRRNLLCDPRRTHDRVVRTRRGGAASLAGDPARLPRRPPTAQQGNALPGRPADGGGDRGGNAPHPR